VPTNLIGIGLNYKQHAEETGLEYPKYPIVFHKNVSSVTSHGKNILIPKSTKVRKLFPSSLYCGLCIVLYCIVLYCIVLYCIVLYCIVLYCIVLYGFFFFVELHYIVLWSLFE
jgi:hypothetical protein